MQDAKEVSEGDALAQVLLIADDHVSVVVEGGN